MASEERFTPSLLVGLDEPVRRYFEHAVREDAPLAVGASLRMTGRIRVGRWLPFTAGQDIDGRSFEWRASVGVGPLKLLRVVDSYGDGSGRTEGRLLGRLRLFCSADPNTARSAAVRTALESVAFAPMSVLPKRGVQWRADSDEEIVASFDLARSARRSTSGSRRAVRSGR